MIATRDFALTLFILFLVSQGFAILLTGSFWAVSEGLVYATIAGIIGFYIFMAIFFKRIK